MVTFKEIFLVKIQRLPLYVSYYRQFSATDGPLRRSSAITIKSGTTPALVALLAVSSNGNTVAGCSAVNSATDGTRRSTLSASCEVRRPPRSCCSCAVRQAAGWLLAVGHSAWKRRADDRQSVRRTGAADGAVVDGGRPWCERPRRPTCFALLHQQRHLATTR
ncbi:hypothetical protein M514_05929 [Trichuris suis]|uniref:Uncharacterized protein n=1 Tax=Trichuris suis TaxID=68888 RepID=A0A085M7M3_9BILA|nr:hypothetical protein M513_05929 [Trichuris suis]KFD65570.1 hypothetical protein M514_05929 [Trichuris suis]